MNTKMMITLPLKEMYKKAESWKKRGCPHSCSIIQEGKLSAFRSARTYEALIKSLTRDYSYIIKPYPTYVYINLDAE